jgi:Cu+-exporting ATPase
VNDAPALAAADVGVAVGGGADVAADAADVVLMRRDLAGVAATVALGPAHGARDAAEPVLGLRLQRGRHPDRRRVAVPSFGLLLSPVLASLAMAVSSVSVVTNQLRLRRLRLG